jgi:hypothetical protein
MENRAAVFTSQPQAVEIYQSGAWWPGELLGWRHDADGTCQVWVRVVLGGVEESAWTDLATLRLPEGDLGLAAERSAGEPAARPTSTPRSSTEAGNLAETASLPLVRDFSGAPARATAATLSQALTTAPTPSSAARSGGRRRAPEVGPTTGVPAGGAAPAAPAAAAGARGRHRAPADPGRHRAADTGLLPPVTTGADAADTATARRPAVPGAGRSLPSPRTARPAVPHTSARRDDWGAGIDPEPELLTRPMRLSDLAPHSRRPRLDGSLAGV